LADIRNRQAKKVENDQARDKEDTDKLKQATKEDIDRMADDELERNMKLFIR
jgi:hypothetical protein